MAVEAGCLHADRESPFEPDRLVPAQGGFVQAARTNRMNVVPPDPVRAALIYRSE